MTALSYLRSVEWCGVGVNGKRCVECNRYSYQDHADCPLAAAIADAEELEKRRGLRTREEVEDELKDRPALASDYYGYALRWVLGEG